MPTAVLRTVIEGGNDPIPNGAVHSSTLRYARPAGLVSGIINFAPVKLQLPHNVIAREVCFICELAILSHLINNPNEASQNGKRRKR